MRLTEDHEGFSRMSSESIQLRGARQHNLKGIDLDIPHGKLTVICGVSGSGKTSLALETLYAEGQRRYIESFSVYSRQFLQRIDKPRFDSLENLPPSIAITRGERGRNNRSTVGTVSETLEALRLVFTHASKLYCHTCGQKVERQSVATVCNWISSLPSGRALLGFEVSWTKKTELADVLFELQSAGFIRVVVQGKTVEISEQDRTGWAKLFPAKGQAFVVVDRIVVGSQSEQLADSLETSFQAGLNGICVLLQEPVAAMVAEPSTSVPSREISVVDERNYSVHRFSDQLRCDRCDVEYPEPETRLFNFNSPIGACEECQGFGETVSIDMSKIIPDESLSIREGAIAPWRTPSYEHELHELLALADDYKIPVDDPVSKLKERHWKLITEGVPERKFGGLNGFFAWLERKKYKMHIRAFLARWRSYKTCAVCSGKRLQKTALSYRLNGRDIAQWNELSVVELLAELQLVLSQTQSPSELPADLPAGAIAGSTSGSQLHLHSNVEEKSVREPIEKLRGRLEYLSRVGLGYLSLNRAMHTLSTGESQRVSLTTLLGSDLVDMLYVLDEPTVGLHPSDTERLAEAVNALKDRGNTLVLIEHEPYFVHHADEIIEIGPGAGEAGGELVFHGTPDQLKGRDSSTASFVFGRNQYQRTPRLLDGRSIVLKGATGRNLQSVDLQVPLGGLCVVAGVSGSGKSTLVLDTLCPAIDQYFGVDAEMPLPFASLAGAEHISKCVSIDQSPIARSSRSSPATYTKVMDEIRAVFADTPDAKQRSMTAGHFSYNSASGQCPTCEGAGFTVVDMQFMADVNLVCLDCHGTRFKPEVLEVKYRDVSIAEVLEMNANRAQEFFRGYPKVQSKLRPLIEIGLGYLPLGQSLSTLSAGELTRLKLASYLDTSSTGKALFVLDEPTAGLHFKDIERLIQCLDVLIDHGNSVLIVEHNQQILKAADYVIELGPGAGPDGGRIIAHGTYAEFLKSPDSKTSQYL